MQDISVTLPYFPESVEKSNGKATVRNIAQQKALGAYYTPSSTADYISSWAVRNNGEHIVEPSFGDGSFLKAIARTAQRKQFDNITLTGIEINNTALNEVPSLLPIKNINLCHEDFLKIAPTPAQAVIGNPPYVRLRQLPETQSRCAIRAAKIAGHDMDPAGSIWMPFVLHATQFLTHGGRLAFVLPYDFTYVRYARPLWAYLGKNFGDIKIVRTHERLFADIYQEVVLLLADNYGTKTKKVIFEAYETVDELLRYKPTFIEKLSLEDIVDGKRVFIEALLSPELRNLLSGKLNTNLTEARKQITFNIGYVSGDKNFFHPSKETVKEYSISPKNLKPAVVSTRMLKGAGLFTSGLLNTDLNNLFLPLDNNLNLKEKEYIVKGENEGVSKRYKCQIRQPWYIVPGVKIPDFILTVFSERPILLINDANFAASNSLLCGYCKKGMRDSIITAWYTSLTLLQCELEVHSLGGGVMVVIPGEAGNIKLPIEVQSAQNHLEEINKLLISGYTEDAYKAGDNFVLHNQLGLTDYEIKLIKEGVKTLTHWRTSSRYTLNEI